MAKSGESTKETVVEKITLWGSHSSSCTWRVRLALDLKGIPFEYKALSNGEHESEERSPNLSPILPKIRKT